MIKIIEVTPSVVMDVETRIVNTPSGMLRKTADETVFFHDLNAVVYGERVTLNTDEIVVTSNTKLVMLGRDLNGDWCSASFDKFAIVAQGEYAITQGRVVWPVGEEVFWCRSRDWSLMVELSGQDSRIMEILGGIMT